MKIKTNGNTVFFIGKDNKNDFCVNQANDNDIYFMSENPNITFTLEKLAIEHPEYQTYKLFDSLIKEMVGNFVMDEYATFLPKDFIDIPNKTITIHSDSGSDNTLKFQYVKDGNLTITIIKGPNVPDYYNNAIRICTSGSRYNYYWHYFVKFYKALTQLAISLNEPAEDFTRALKIEE